MSLSENAELNSILESTKAGMLGFLGDGVGMDYTKAHVDECMVILQEFRDSAHKTHSLSEAMDCVRDAVLALNKLNERGGEQLIETGEREQICEFMGTCLDLLGYDDRDADVTENWRDW